MVTKLPGIGGRRVNPAISGEIPGFKRGGELDGMDIEKRGSGGFEERGSLCIYRKFGF